MYHAQIHKKGVEAEEASSLDDVSGKKALTRDDLRLWSRITRMLKKYSTTITSSNSPSTLCIQLLPSHKSNGEEEATVKLQDVQSYKISGEELVGAAGSAGGGGGGGEYFVDHVKGKKDVGTSAAARVAIATRHVWQSSSITRLVKKYSAITVRSSSSFCLQLTHHKNATAAAGGEEEANTLESNKTNGVGILGPSAEEKLVNEEKKGSE
ncbi:unnamed protein product [Sphagnum jensenii]|uniref:Uncharacterized protein n=2 Tax=Sphagnum jensenii TaxID=128206 RepID=A0ABP1A393_9BRYO